MSLKKSAESVRRAGRGKDTELVHLTRREVAGLQELADAMGGKLGRNPETGLPEAGFLDSMLPTILGVAANFIVPGSGVLVGGLTGALQNKENPLMGAALGAMGGYGGGQIGQGLANMGQAAAVDGMITGAAQNALPSAATAAGQGLAGAVANPGTALSYMGGPMAAAKSAGMALAPALYGQMGAEDGGKPPGWANAKGEGYDYDAGYTGGQQTGPSASSERRWFTPQYTRRYADGGVVDMETGGFVIPADVVSMAGGGSTDAGLAALAQRVGARPIKGAGGGQSDDIPARIDGRPVARVANGEAYVPRDTVKKLGGARKLYKAMDSIRQQAHGTKKQQRPVSLQKAMA